MNTEKDAINADELAGKLETSMLITHAVRGLSDNTPWYRGELFDGMKRQIHEGYTAQNWYSYDNTAWSKGKISKYQFRNPSEEFAELYSSYHVADPKGSKNSAKHKKWFESKGLHKMQQ